MLLSGCSFKRDHNYVPSEQSHLYWKTIEATVTSNNAEHWFAVTHQYEVETTVYNEEYDLEETIYSNGTGAFGCPWQYNLEENDIVEVTLYSWVYDSTGEVIKREIHCIERKVEK